jgi:hypothetical protein
MRLDKADPGFTQHNSAIQILQVVEILSNPMSRSAFLSLAVYMKDGTTGKGRCLTDEHLLAAKSA